MLVINKELLATLENSSGEDGKSSRIIARSRSWPKHWVAASMLMVVVGGFVVFAPVPVQQIEAAPIEVMGKYDEQQCKPVDALLGSARTDFAWAPWRTDAWCACTPKETTDRCQHFASDRTGIIAHLTGLLAEANTLVAAAALLSGIQTGAAKGAEVGVHERPAAPTTSKIGAAVGGIAGFTMAQRTLRAAGANAGVVFYSLCDPEMFPFVSTQSEEDCLANFRHKDATILHWVNECEQCGHEFCDLDLVIKRRLPWVKNEPDVEVGHKIGPATKEWGCDKLPNHPIVVRNSDTGNIWVVESDDSAGISWSNARTPCDECILHFVEECEQCGQDFCSQTWQKNQPNVEVDYKIGRTLADWGCSRLPSNPIVVRNSETGNIYVAEA